MNSLITVLIDVLYAKRFNGIIGFISSSKYLNEAENLHISNPIDFLASWIITSEVMVFEISFADVELVEYLQTIKDREAHRSYLNRVNVALVRTDLKLKCVGYSVDLSTDIRRVKLQFCQR